MRFMRLLNPLRTQLFALSLVGLALGVFVLTGCDLAGTSSDTSEVDIGFTTTSSSTSSLQKLAEDELDITGSNGTLNITDIRLIVDEVELEGDDDNAEFEMEKPFFLDLPLDGTDVASVVTGQVPPGTYTEFEFEVEDADFDDDDDDEEQELQNLRDEILSEGFSNWPDDASMVVVGTFTEDGTTRSFITYFDAEIEVEIDMEDRPFEVGGDDASRRLTVNLDPARWFTKEDGTVQDLSQDNYTDTDELVEFELEYEFEDGVREIEFDD